MTVDATPEAGTGTATDGASHPLIAIDRVYSQAFSLIQSLLERLQEGHQVLQESGARKLRDTNAKLQEVSSATESAAMNIMDGVGRALELVDRLEEEQAPSSTSGDLRDELFDIMNLLQFQDITTQQLQYTSSLLKGLEAELLDFVSRVGGMDGDVADAIEAAGETFNPQATMDGSEARQGAVDALLLSVNGPCNSAEAAVEVEAGR